MPSRPDKFKLNIWISRQERQALEALAHRYGDLSLTKTILRAVLEALEKLETSQ
jgi:hypothetical protein